MNKILDFFAQTHTPYLHARGKQGTAVLLAALNPVRGERILELGFGTGQTLADIAGRWPGVELFGVEKSQIMLDVAQRRLRFCGLKNVNLVVYNERLPFPDNFFDGIYGESVLAIVPEDALPGLFLDLFRVLKPGGRLCCNESLWRPETTAETIQTINLQCLDVFGIVQASARYPYPAQWRALGASAGFQCRQIQSLENLPVSTKLPFNRTRLLSALFSRLGWLKRRLLPKLRQANRQWRKNERSFGQYGRFLEGQLLVFEKPH